MTSNTNDQKPLSQSGNKSIGMAFRILDELASDRQELGVTELAKRLGEQKGRVHRHLATLRTYGVVSQDVAGERYRLGWKILQLGIAAAENLNLTVLAQRHMNRLRETANLTVILAVPAGGDAVAVECLPSEAPVAVVVKKGALFQVNTSSLGRALLAFGTPELQEEMIKRPMARHTDFSIIDPAKLQARLQLIRQRFYEIAVNENIYGVSAMAAPIFDQRNQVVAAVGMVGSHFHIGEETTDLIAVLQETASSISEDLKSVTWDNWRAEQLRAVESAMKLNAVSRFE